MTTEELPKICKHFKDQMVEKFVPTLMEHEHYAEIEKMIRPKILEKVVNFLGDLVCEEFKTMSSDFNFEVAKELRQHNNRTIAVITKSLGLMIHIGRGEDIPRDQVKVINFAARTDQPFFSWSEELFLSAFIRATINYLDGYLAGMLDALTKNSLEKEDQPALLQKKAPLKKLAVETVVDSVLNQAEEITISDEKDKQVRAFLENLMRGAL